MVQVMLFETAPFSVTFGTNVAFESEVGMVVLVVNQFLLIDGDVATDSTLH